SPALLVSIKVAVPQPVPATNVFAQMLVLVPSDCRHTAIASPAGSVATWTSSASPALLVSSSRGQAQPGPGAERSAPAVYRVPSDCCHTAIAAPSGLDATSAFRPSAVVSSADARPQPTPGTNRFASITHPVPVVKRSHTAIASPARSEAICGRAT